MIEVRFRWACCPAVAMALVLLVSASTVGASDTGLVEVSVGAGKIHEECFRTRRQQQVLHSFRSDRPLDFNIHYHQGEEVEYLRRDEGATAVERHGFVYARGGQLCWMWTNTGVDVAALAYRIGLE